MKRYCRDLLLIITIFFITFAFAEELQCCSDKTTDLVHKERLVISGKRAHGSISQMSRARGVYGGGSLIRPKGKKNIAMASMTKSASLAMLQVTVAILIHLFLN
ncbi:hypothetical protein Bca4012_007922 [Brassica carinata]|uniref:BnaC03g77510D protein n=5 Tax=Brassica TaxID=3705 RepID=A0A078IYZ2_BRANA|nr:PREDICTED: uncharacterized protein LOC106334326 [Brassica oleracea var. oleracea]KAF3509807.1 hypothetical protein F2Q69_00009815 [Brassica cretica]KAH0894876.1 hypothetical protein HID58_057305 [Brassica napus]VDD00697.1 unnamed protein product [Brassica oleracea]CAF1712018.1 unnamed protein product [Brassica napus]CDY55616.1 BnaC03g77510D [Brassica napus]